MSEINQTVRMDDSTARPRGRPLRVGDVVKSTPAHDRICGRPTRGKLVELRARSELDEGCDMQPLAFVDSGDAVRSLCSSWLTLDEVSHWSRLVVGTGGVTLEPLPYTNSGVARAIERSVADALDVAGRVARALIDDDAVTVDRELRCAPWTFDLGDGRGLRRFAEARADVKPSGRCPRCAGPAVELLTSVRCERVGGCRTLEERIGEPQMGIGRSTNMEAFWVAFGRGLSITHPTSEGAIAAWREKAIAAEGGK
jgi:hypothetical protein